MVLGYCILGILAGLIFLGLTWTPLGLTALLLAPFFSSLVVTIAALVVGAVLP
jgi:hypothetical protein